MLTQRQIDLLKHFGPAFIKQSGDITDACLHLETTAASVMTYEEWVDCMEALTKFSNELSKCRSIVWNRLKEAGIPCE